jgi:hypothetical protein
MQDPSQARDALELVKARGSVHYSTTGVADSATDANSVPLHRCAEHDEPSLPQKVTLSIKLLR